MNSHTWLPEALKNSHTWLPNHELKNKEINRDDKTEKKSTQDFNIDKYRQLKILQEEDKTYFPRRSMWIGYSVASNQF